MDKNLQTQREAEDFLEHYAMGYQNLDVLNCAEEFREEMNRGIRGKKCSLRMIPTYYAPAHCFESGKPVLVLDAGGTNLRAAVVQFDASGMPSLKNYCCKPMPGVQNEISADEFFDQVALFLDPLLSASDIIAFCFSYASKPTPERDGIAEEMGKQLKVSGMAGRSLAHGLGEALKRTGCQAHKRIIVLNDSVSTLLGGVSASRGRLFSGYIGLILGTGLNASYVECSKNFTGLYRAYDGPIIVNTESGNYNRFPRGQMDEMYDRTLLDTGKWQFEKMVSGRFQGGLLYTVLRQAVSDRLFSENFINTFSNVKSLTARQIDEFLDFPRGENALASCCSGTQSDDDALRLYFLISALTERAAKFLVANLAALLLQSGSGKSPLYPACITADGSTFYKSKLFRGKMEYYVHTCIKNRLGLYCEFHQVENVNLIGAAIASLCSEAF